MTTARRSWVTARSRSASGPRLHGDGFEGLADVEVLVPAELASTARMTVMPPSEVHHGAGISEQPDTQRAGVPSIFAELYSQTGQVRRAAFLALCDGEPLTPSEVATRAGLPHHHVSNALARLAQSGLVRQDEQRRIVGIAGLGVEPSAHQLTLKGVRLFTWCALDAVGIPAALGLDAEVVTRCWHCSATIQLELPAGQPPRPSALRLWLPVSACDNVFEQFCGQANLFCHAEHLQAWKATAHHPPGRALDLAASAELGRETWAEFGTDQRTG